MTRLIVGHSRLLSSPHQHSTGTGFNAPRAGVRQNEPLPIVRQIDIAPTIARLLGFEMPDVDGVAMVGLLR